MLTYAIIFFFLALVSGALGFGVMAGAAAYVAQLFFFVFVVLFLVALVRGRKVPTS